MALHIAPWMAGLPTAMRQKGAMHVQLLLTTSKSCLLCSALANEANEMKR